MNQHDARHLVNNSVQYSQQSNHLNPHAPTYTGAPAFQFRSPLADHRRNALIDANLPPRFPPFRPAVPQCTGVELKWDPTLFVSYPFPAHWSGHKPEPGYHFTFIGRDPTRARIASDHCLGFSENGGPCSNCANLTSKVAMVRHRASSSKHLTGRSHENMEHIYHQEQARVNELKLKVRSAYFFLQGELLNEL